MGRNALATTACFVSLFTLFNASSAKSQDLIWQVENPFRFFKGTRSFALHEAAYNAVRGNGPIPSDIVWRTERKLNDPDCRDQSTPDRCAATAGRNYQQSRLGWAAQTLTDTCYEVNGKPRRYSAACERRYSWGTAKEDFVLPDAHTVVITIAPEHLAGIATGECYWAWQGRKAGSKVETKKLPCGDKLTIARVPYSLDRSQSGVAVAVRLPDGRDLREREVVVEDIFIVALGDSFSSGESNPDRPVQFSAAREMVYDPKLLRDQLATGPDAPPPAAALHRGFGLASGDQVNPKVLPRRLMEDELAERYNKLDSQAFQAAFDKAAAQWLSRDCHRSQYGYPFRVGIQLALEDRHRAITFASFSCSGAEIAHGLFLELDAREGYSDRATAKVKPQLDQLADLICRGNRTQQATYTLPVFSIGSTSITPQRITKSWCPPSQRKRPIDVVLMSIGGNDVGFGGLIAYSMTDSAADFAPVAAALGSSLRFGTQVSRVYMDVLDERFKALKEALHDGFGVPPARVFQSSYEPIQYDETGALCGAQPTLGMDVHPGLKLNKQRLGETAEFLRDFLGRLDCITSSAKGRSCPANLATGAGTGFNLVTDHIPEFTKRGLCARDPRRALVDGINMRVPRKTPSGEEWKPYSPAATIPYARHWRLFRTPNDAFLMANTHREQTSLFDILQPAWAGLYSGAIHPTAEAHAIVADHMVKHVRKAVEKRELAETAAR